MKIVHSIHSKETLQATLSGVLYQNPVGVAEDYYPGWRCEILLVTRDTLTGTDEPIYLEGEAKDVRHALASLLAMLDCEDKHKRAEFKRKRKGKK